MFYVVGGEFTDTTFAEIVDDGEPERHGPFATYDEALRKWRALTGWTVDSCCTRYLIEEADRSGG